MDQETRWLTRYNEVKEFIEQNHRNPSRHRIEKHDMLNWLKANRKHLNVGSLKPEDRGGTEVPRHGGYKYPRYAESDRGLNQSGFFIRISVESLFFITIEVR